MSAPHVPADAPRHVRRRVEFGAWWDRTTEWPLAAAALLFLVAYSVIALDTELTRSQRHVLGVVDYLTWALFVIDYVIRLFTAYRRVHWFTHNLLELAIVALPILRPLRLLRLFTLIRALNKRAVKSFHGRVGLYTGVASLLVIYGGSLAVLQAERGQPGANIQSFGISLWWTMTTITTVGYGDYTPVTVTGRIIAVALMLTGIALIGIITASIASSFIGRVKGPDTGEDKAVTRAADRTESDEDATAKELRELRAQIMHLTSLLETRDDATPQR